jgi:hypothetical protein
MIDYKLLYEESLKENEKLRLLLGRAHKRIDSMRTRYKGTGSDYLDCVLGIGGFEQYGPIKGVKGLTDDE